MYRAAVYIDRNPGLVSINVRDSFFSFRTRRKVISNLLRRDGMNFRNVSGRFHTRMINRTVKPRRSPPPYWILRNPSTRSAPFYIFLRAPCDNRRDAVIILGGMNFYANPCIFKFIFPLRLLGAEVGIFPQG